MSRYYKPAIEEFHVGFEYEVKQLTAIKQDFIKSSDIKLDKWIKLTWDSLSSPENTFNVFLENGEITNILVPDSVRVKYLDKEDIESLGFGYGGKSCPDGTWEKEESVVDTWCHYVDTTENKEKYYSLYLQGNFWYITYTAYQNSVGRTVEQVFRGTIKNKSEFSKVIKQLNINN